MARGRVGVHMSSVKPIIGQCNIDLRADTIKDMALSIITKKLKVAGGADYDTGYSSFPFIYPYFSSTDLNIYKRIVPMPRVILPLEISNVVRLPATR